MVAIVNRFSRNVLAFSVRENAISRNKTLSLWVFENPGNDLDAIGWDLLACLQAGARTGWAAATAPLGKGHIAREGAAVAQTAMIDTLLVFRYASNASVPPSEP